MKIFNIQNKNILILGLGHSGLASINLSLYNNANVFIYDDDKLSGTHVQLSRYIVFGNTTMLRKNKTATPIVLQS